MWWSRALKELTDKHPDSYRVPHDRKLGIYSTWKGAYCRFRELSGLDIPSFPLPSTPQMNIF